mmetsp:Transcript_9215/g.25783  ORF Transcript_9215/g.25783 Transcript_9215/m.25783 type:complete len:203 (-) Transcript_9215:12-620(-)
MPAPARRRAGRPSPDSLTTLPGGARTLRCCETLGTSCSPTGKLHISDMASLSSQTSRGLTSVEAEASRLADRTSELHLRPIESEGSVPWSGVGSSFKHKPGSTFEGSMTQSLQKKSEDASQGIQNDARSLQSRGAESPLVVQLCSPPPSVWKLTPSLSRGAESSLFSILLLVSNSPLDSALRFLGQVRIACALRSRTKGMSG